MAAHMTYLVCRKAPDRPDGVVYFSGDWTLSRTRTSSIVVAHSRMFRREAWEGDEISARMIADIINGLGPNAGVPDAPKWEVLPAAIEMREKAPASQLGEEAQVDAASLAECAWKGAVDPERFALALKRAAEDAIEKQVEALRQEKANAEVISNVRARIYGLDTTSEGQ